MKPKVQSQFRARLALFLEDERAVVLRVHTLQGAMYPCESMNITGDVRAIFLREGNTVTFYEIGTHSELY